MEDNHEPGFGNEFANEFHEHPAPVPWNEPSHVENSQPYEPWNEAEQPNHAENHQPYEPWNEAQQPSTVAEPDPWGSTEESNGTEENGTEENNENLDSENGDNTENETHDTNEIDTTTDENPDTDTYDDSWDLEEVTNADLAELIKATQASVQAATARAEFYENLVQQLQSRIETLQTDQVHQLLSPAFQRLAILLTQSADAAELARSHGEGYKAEVEFDYFRETLQATLELMGVHSVGARIGVGFDRTVHSAMRTVPTAHEDQDWTIAKVARQGLISVGSEQAFLPAQVAVYRFDPESASEVPIPSVNEGEIHDPHQYDNQPEYDNPPAPMEEAQTHWNQPSSWPDEPTQWQQTVQSLETLSSFPGQEPGESTVYPQPGQEGDHQYE
ncbi:MAG: nucleotide exchange factor GrpE [Propionibacteriaceae bacterium]|jgi:molecular chaperone GrpE (heat shock protein)|nr:nucleotide exchange factor GrpE [Propionibacteriaceae bacterium]